MECKFCGLITDIVPIIDGKCPVCLGRKRSRRSPRKGIKDRKESLSKYYVENKEEIRLKQNKYRKENPDARKKSDANRRIRVFLSKGGFCQSDVNQILQNQKNRCAICNKKITKYHVDHIVPLCKNGTNDKSNIQITCPSCNLKKGSKDPFYFANENGKLL